MRRNRQPLRQIRGQDCRDGRADRGNPKGGMGCFRKCVKQFKRTIDRKKRQQNRCSSGQNLLRLRGQRLRYLGVKNGRNSLYSCGSQSFGYVPPAFLAPQMKQWAALILGKDQRDQGRGVTIGGNGQKTGLARGGGGAVTHRIGKARKGGGNPLARGHGSLRRQNQRAKRAVRNRWRVELRGKQGRDDNPKGAKRRGHFGGEPFRLQGRSGQQEKGGVGLSDHRLGVTSGWTHRQRKAMNSDLTFLGIESSCDDTAAAVVRHRAGLAPEILSSVVEGQVALHAAFGGVVPEIAARAHAERLDHCVEAALAEAGVSLQMLDGIAVTAGPGLIGGVLSGVMLAKGLAAATGLPMVGVNHLAGHALTPRLTDDLPFPYLMLLVSGGHCQFLIAEGPEDFRRLGGTIDDAPGEAFDKTAKLLGLPQPGGPMVETEARLGDATRFKFPRPLLDRPGCDMSFSGLKTALLRARDALIADQGGLSVQDRRDLCAGFQEAVAAVLAEKTRRALRVYEELNPARPAFAVAGGVAANGVIRAMLETVCAESGTAFLAPPLRLCTDNAAMIAWAGIERFRQGGRDDATLVARPRWPLDKTAPALIGSGKKGAKG